MRLQPSLISEASQPKAVQISLVQIEHVLQRTHALEKTSTENAFYRERILQRTHSAENTFYREYVLQRPQSIRHPVETSSLSLSRFLSLSVISLGFGSYQSLHHTRQRPCIFFCVFFCVSKGETEREG